MYKGNAAKTLTFLMCCLLVVSPGQKVFLNPFGLTMVPLRESIFNLCDSGVLYLPLSQHASHKTLAKAKPDNSLH
jgi:hypothetical protein